MPVLAILLSLLQSVSPPARGPDTLVIHDVSVLPMTGAPTLQHRDVVITNGRVVEIVATKQRSASPTTAIVEGRGTYLVPGLADMHVHLTTAAELPMYVGYGVLTVRDLNGSPETLEWRQRTASGAIVGPRIFASGPMIAGAEIPWRNKVTPTTATEADSIVRAQKRAGYDQIKIYDGISKDVFSAAVAAAAREGLPSSGHIPADVGFDGILSSQMMGFEHLDKIVFAVTRHDLDTLRIPDIAARIKAAGKWVTPTLESMIELSLVGTGRFDSLMARPAARAAPSEIRDFWTTVTARLKGNRTLPATARCNPFCEYQLRLAGALARAGVPLLAGTDLPNAVLVPGYSLHDELDAMESAGLTRYQVLEAATSAPARFFKQTADWGTIAVGQRANLVLSDANPLDGLRTLRDPRGVVLNGRWLDRAALAALRGSAP